MKPVLYVSTAVDFSNNGIGVLADAVSCVITQELNGQYELQMQYPITGAFYGDIALRSIIKALPDPVSDPQPFRVYRITKPINGIVTVYARHIAYDLDGIVCNAFTADTVDLALQGFVGNAVTPCGFLFYTDKSTAAAYTLKYPQSVWSQLGGTQGSILDVYGGEYEFDGLTVNLWNHRGTDTGVSVRYGKNMTDFEQDAEIANVYTAVYPYWHDPDGNDLTVMATPLVPVPGVFDFDRVLPLDCSEDFEEQPSDAQLLAKATAYISANNVGVPAVSWRVGMALLDQSPEYANIAALERVSMGDTVHVYFDRLGVTASARCVGMEFDALREKYNRVQLGRVKSSLPQLLVTQEQEIAEKPSRTLAEQISDNIGAALMGVNDGSVRMLDTNGDGSPDTLYIADNPDPAQAVRVWRFNYLGWGVSTTGYNGTYTMGATLEKGLLANFVTAANLRAGTIQSADGSTFYLDLTNGILNMDAKSISLNGANIGDFLRFSYVNGKPVLQLGSSQSAITLKILNDRIAFYDNNGTELAYWNNNAFNIVALQRFGLGSLALIEQPNGSTSFVPSGLV